LEKKKKTYILLVAVLGLWGTIGFKVVGALTTEESVVGTENVSVKFSPEKAKVTTFSISKVKRDPFLGKLSKSAHTLSLSKSKQIKKDDLNNPWPQIQYQGLVKKKGANSSIFIVTINQEQYLLKSNQEIKKVRLLKGNTKEIQVRFNKRVKTFVIQ